MQTKKNYKIPHPDLGPRKYSEHTETIRTGSLLGHFRMLLVVFLIFAARPGVGDLVILIVVFCTSGLEVFLSPIPGLRDHNP